LPGAVDADDAGALAGGQSPGDVVEEVRSPTVIRRVDEVDDVLAETGRGEPHELDAVTRPGARRR
jgi:hypothetical protein